MSKNKSNGPNEPLLPSERPDQRKPGRQHESPESILNTSDEVVIKEERLKSLDDVYEGFGTFHPYFMDRLLVTAFIYFVLHLPISYMDFIVDLGLGTSGCFETMNETMYTFWWYCRCSDSSLTNTSDTMKSDTLVIYIDKSSHRNPYDDAPYICFIFVSIFGFLFSGRSRRMSLLWLLSFLSFFSTLIVAMSWCEWSGSTDSKCEGKESRYLTGPFMAILIAFCRLGGGLIMCQLIELAPLRLRPITIASYIMGHISAGSLSTVVIGVSIYVIYLKEMSVAIIVWLFAVLSITPIPLSFLYVQDTPYFYLAKARIDSLQRCFEQILKRKACASKIRPDKLVDDLAFETREVVDSVIDRVGVVARAWRLPLKIFVLLVIGQELVHR
ncbi:hypothetical protein WR25_05160 [Diploscapter pachys]|uniref:Uncharacterized protein n=1 Tax=Diploscapter pachys TaxID=2018661 RepID=A0A2A2JZK3_9BILA|nr:hypothetical protein WR25_05160 [Diploscapter pachys]